MSKEMTHKVVITITSSHQDPLVHMEIEYGPIAEIAEDLTYVPAAYVFVERALIGAMEHANEEATLEEGPTPNRQLN